MSDPLNPPPTMADLQFGSFNSDDELNVFTASPLQPTSSSSPSKQAPLSQSEVLPPSASASSLRFNYSVDESVDIPESDIGDADTDQLLAPDETRNNNSFWTFEYYQQFFEVDTMDVARRLMGSMVPRPGANYLQTVIRPNPDLYGPLWVAITLVFTTGVCGNLSSLAASLQDPQNSPYHFSFKKVTLAATVIFCYWWLLPMALRLVFWWRKSRSNVTFLESICVYGYSLAVYIPISVLWLVPIPIFQKFLVIIGMVLSGSVLVLTFWPAVRDDDKKVAYGVAAAILLFHGLLALGFLLYFFHYQAIPVDPSTVTSSAAPTTTTTTTTTTTVKT